MEPMGTIAGTGFPLGLLLPGERVEILSVRENAGRAGDGRVEELGLRVGRFVEMLANGTDGPLLLKVDEARVAIDRRIAMRIMVGRPS
jgi:ferrous iron transport protein A